MRQLIDATYNLQRELQRLGLTLEGVTVQGDPGVFLVTGEPMVVNDDGRLEIKIMGVPFKVRS